MKPKKPKYCPDCSKLLKLSNIIERFTMHIYWCETCEHIVTVDVVHNILVIKKGSKPIQWIN